MDSTALGAVFFDIGATLGVVENKLGMLRLKIYPTTLELLRVTCGTLGLRGGIISNIPEELTTEVIKKMLDAAGILGFLDRDAIITSRDAGVSKPDRKIFVYAADRVGLPASRCLYIGEDPHEVAGAQAAGMSGLIKPVPMQR
jgi:HAD superfamily hydrolase (TIGR01549 family)